MKRFFYYLLMSTVVLASFLLVVSCDNELEESALSEEISVDYDNVMNGLGLDFSSAIDMGDYFIVEGDMMITKDQLSDYRKDITTRQARTDYLVSLEKRYDIKIKIASDVYDTWKGAIRNAIANWNSFPGLYMHEVTSGDVDIEIGMRNIAALVVALASFPSSNGEPGSTVFINRDFANSYNLRQATLIMTHELGHCIGFRHTNWRVNETSQPAVTIGGTPDGLNPDPKSIMNYDIAGASWKGFSNYDKIATDLLYKGPAILGPKSICDCSDVNYTLENIPSGATVQWKHYESVNGIRVYGYCLNHDISGNPCIVKVLSGKKGDIYLEAQLILPDGNYKETSTSIKILSHSTSYIEQADWDFYVRNYGNYASNFQWSAPGGVIHMQDNSGWAFIEYLGGGGPYTITCTYTAECGKRIALVKDDVSWSN